MWDKRERVLAITVFAALYWRVAVGAAKQLDMAPDAVDDLYLRCRDQMLEKVTSGLLSEELGRSAELKTAWSANNCSTLIPGGVAEHTAALLAYAYGGKEFRKTFNNEVESMGGNASVYSNFHFKSLHFLLTDALRLSKEKCQTVYRVSGKNYMPQKGSQVRFGRFTSVQADHSELKEEPDLEGGVFFNITSCSVLNVEENTCSQEGEIELLLSPSEVFTVEEVKHISDDYKYTEIVLKSAKLSTTDRCYLFPRSPTDSSTQWLGSIVLVLMALSFFLFTC
ncbi:ecto-ADP-ribosyltransferase 5 [Centroberyx affinis]|uniref:ecto-ADP-ribosyltransferase 5 n=1 Tax=Centroberyx affinis TaxID=166261 RepID=UPI003A5C01BE